MSYYNTRISASERWYCFLQPVGFVTFATKDDAEAAKLELQVQNSLFFVLLQQTTFFVYSRMLYNEIVFYGCFPRIIVNNPHHR